MFLRELFEGNENTVGIIFGRFNPPHKGHKAAWEMASKNAAWYVGTNKSTQGPKDPLPFDVKIAAMTTVWPEVADHIVAETSWLTLASKVFAEHKDAELICYTDEDWVTKTIIQYNGKEGPHGYYNFSNIKQQATPRLSSATALRDAVTKGDREAFAQAAGVPADISVAGKPFFDLVAEYLLPYANAPKKAPAKKKGLVPAEESIKSTVKRGLKSIKRRIQGWDKSSIGPGGEKIGDPKEIVKRNKSHDDATVQRLHKTITGPGPGFPFRNGDYDGADKHSPAGLQKRVLDREMKKRKLGENTVCRVCGQTPCNCTYVSLKEHYQSTKLTESVLNEMAMDSITVPKYGKLLWLNDNGAHMIAKREVNGSLHIYAIGNHKQIAEKWAMIKKKYGQKTEDAAGVGIVNKQNSTCDVGPGTLRKNLKAFHLTDDILEAAYSGNIGMMELVQFFSKADPGLVEKVKALIAEKRNKEVWNIIQKFTNTKLVGKEFGND